MARALEAMAGRWRSTALGLLLALTIAACGSPPGHELRTLEQLTDMASAGDLGAQTALGQVYEKGLGVRQNLDQALRWYARATEGGDALAPFHVGALYERGVLVSQDYAEAAAWYRISAERGNDAAQASLAYLYEHGLGVPQDYAEALRWYEAAQATWNLRAEYPVEAGYATGREGAGYGDPPSDLFGPEAPDAPPAGAESLPEPEPDDPLAALFELLVPAGETPEPAMPALDPGAVEVAALSVPEGAALDAGSDETFVMPVPEAKPEPPEAGEVAVHLASFRTADAAAREWDRLAAYHGAMFDGLDPLLDGVALGGEEGFVRLLAAPFTDETAAQFFCDALTRANHFCKVAVR